MINYLKVEKQNAHATGTGPGSYMPRGKQHLVAHEFVDDNGNNGDSFYTFTYESVVGKEALQ